MATVVEQLPAWAQREVGGLPVWAWGAVGSAGVGIGVYLRRSSVFGDDAPGPTGVDLGPLGVPNGATPVLGPGSGDAVNTTDLPITTNAQWLQRAVELAISLGYTALEAQRALDLYLQGESAARLTSTQQDIVNAILDRLGVPPSPPVLLPGPDPDPDPTPDDPPPGAGGDPDPPSTYAVQSGDYPWKVAAKLYGEGKYWPSLYYANQGAGLYLSADKRDVHMRVGARITVPRPPTRQAPQDDPRDRSSSGGSTGGGSTGGGGGGSGGGGGGGGGAGGGSTPAPSARTHTVSRGESISLIAGRYYGDVCAWPTIHNASRAVVGSNPHSIRAGMVLTIPPTVSAVDEDCRRRQGGGGGSGGSGGGSGSGGSSSDLDRRFPPRTGARGTVTHAAAGLIYTVASGDNLSSIGARMGANWRTIAASNGIKSPYTIHAGQRLAIG